ncbi:polyketide-type polyunsaturated fatty acid synthase PfaA [Malonomonas rubra DSM 5091]|uniref:Polyketide-type polyunsaturated fatty acid synthase PfaA n=1 Tax=Malonomonas rubra DSM 5091 TaxID=1122189 RepID=A0A1M6LIK2_MALRU|nr:type I polyketide synthase [Malonomonas rubra]SHJ71002.1 polyketide-type polyunsaturated fatty acid synthase PfaA [Malonomonas rubra DSM 5091]
MKNNSGEKVEKPATATPLAIVGIGSLFPQAGDTGVFWSNIKAGVDAITEVPESHWRSDDYFDSDPKTADHVYAKCGGFLSPVDFNPMEYNILPNALEAIDTSQLLGLVAVEQALRDAGYSAEKEFDKDKVSVILGVTGTLELVLPLGARLGFPRWREALQDAGIADNIAEDVMQRISDSYVPWQENSFPGLLGNVVAGRISKHFDFGGTNCVVDAACGSSLSAINLAALELESGKADMVVTGGIDTFNDIFMYTCFSKTPALSPSGHARPFDAESDGTTLGEGLGITVLKRLEDAERDGDKIYAVIKGVGSSSDGRGAAIYEPSATGQTKALRRAYQQAGITPDTIELIEAHGTGTRVGDAIEVSALKEVYGSADSPYCAIGSIKSQIGHTKAAAGSAGIIKAALALHHKVLPPSIKVKKPQDVLLAADSPFYVNTELRPWVPRAGHPRRAAVSALGFGGSNFHCVLEEYPSGIPVVDWNGDVQIVAFSAADRSGLAAALRDFPVDSDWAQLRLTAAESREKFDANQPMRLALVIEKDKTNRAAQQKTALTMLETKSDQDSWSTPDGSYFSAVDASGNLAMLFPGQGAQYTGMLKDLALQFPSALAELEVADHSYLEATDHKAGRLIDKIYPLPTYDDEAALQTEIDLRATENAQPALGAVSLATRAVLAEFGVTAVAYAGHSYGELTALCAAGVLSQQDLHRLSRLRGELMAAGEGDRGSMLAVSAPLADVEKFLAEQKLDLVLANRNTPEQAVLSGTTAEIEKAAALLEQKGMRGKQLAVSAAFHSELVAAAAVPFGEQMEDVKFGKAMGNVYANTSGKIYPADTAKAKKLLAEQLAKPVDFVNEIENIYKAGIRTFVEVGPGARLTGMVKAILGERDYHALAVDSSNGKRSGIADLARVLAQLSSLGCNIDLNLWDAGYLAAQRNLPPKKKGMTVQLLGINHFKKPEKRPPLPQASQQVAAPQPAAAQPVASTPATQAQPAVVTTDSSSLQQALLMTQQSMQALQSLQEQTSRLHQQYLQGQESATKSFLNLVEQQRSLMQGVPLSSQPLVAAPTAAVPPQPLAQPPVVAPVVTEQAPAPQPVQQETFAVPAVDSGKVADVLLSVIAEKTGYPQEMLEMGMSLDADLGIDSIKRVEILSALQEQLPEAPAVKPEDLGILQTLGQIVEHLNTGMPQAAAVVAAAATAVDDGMVAQVLFDVIAEKTGYPVEMLEMEMALDSDLGIDSIKRVEILSALQEKLPEAPAVKPEDLGVLQTLGQIVEHLSSAMPAVAAAPVAAAGIAADQVASVLLEVIAEKTGYPQEMLEMGMALDTDLGIDSIKRVEILSALQEKLPDAPAVKPEDLGVLQTLGQIVEHLSSAMPAVAAAPVAAAGISADQVASVLLEVIAEKTGYPQEMLEMGMALDTDLGIDSIKRVEILSALQEKLPDAPAVKPEDLGVLQTLGQIVEHLAAVGQPKKTTTAPVAPQLGQIDRDTVATTLLSVISEKTGYPVEMLELEMALDTDLGIDSIKRVEILSALQEKLPGAPAIKPEHLGTLQTVGQIVDFLASVSGTAAAKTNALTEEPGAAAGISRQVLKVVPLQMKSDRNLLPMPVAGKVLVTDDGSELTDAICSQLSAKNLQPVKIKPADCDHLDVPDNLAGLLVLAPQGGTDDSFIQTAFRLLQKAEAGLNATAEETAAVFATISRLNGHFGLQPGDEITDVNSGGLAGLSKTAGHEWPKVSCKAIDLATDLESTEKAAAEIVNALLTDGPQEIGLSAQGLHGLKLTETRISKDALELPVAAGDLVVVSGGARGVTAEVAIKLAEASKATLLLLGRSPLPEAEPDWLSGLTDEAQIKKALVTNAVTPLKPRDVAERYQQISSNREVVSTLQRIEAVGGKAIYRSVDLRNADSVTQAVAEIRNQHGQVKGLIHGAGVLADRLIKDKTIEQFASVYSTKIEGLNALLAAVAEDALKFMVMFSSSTGRFGRTGQIDYAVANEILNKVAQQQALQRPDCRVLSLNWGPWDGGMVTPALKKVFEQEGIEVIDLQAGADYLVQEISTPPGGPVELVIVGGEADAVEEEGQSHQNIYVSKAFDLDLSVEQYPFLKSHVIDGKAVLPMAVIVEWMAHGAIHNNPGLRFHGFNDLRILNGVKIENGESHNLQVMTGKAIKSDGMHVVPVELSGVTAKGTQVVHARAKIVLAGKLPESKPAEAKLELADYARSISEIYQPDRLFHGPDFHGIREVLGCAAEGISTLVSPAPQPNSWISQPLRNSWLADPLVLDSSFQMMILWSFEQYKAGSLPVFTGRYRQYQDSFPTSGAEVRVRVTEQSASKATAEVDFVDPLTGVLIARIEDYECVIDASLNESFQRNKLQGVA